MEFLKMKAALYLRVSTDCQSTENQRRELEEAASRRGWTITQLYEDAGLSGAKGRDKRPAFDRMLKDARRGRFDVCMAWAVDRLGRSLQDLVGMLSELHTAKVDLFLLQQGLDTTTPAGKAMFQTLGVFSEFERSMIQARVKAGMARAMAGGKVCGRPSTTPAVEAAIRASLAAGAGINKTAAALGVGNNVVSRIKSSMTA